MTSREQFEAWLCAQPHVLNVGVEQDGTYTLHEDRVAWEAWQASREAVEVELPSLKQTDSGERYVWSDGVFNFKEDAIKAIRAAGIKVIEGEKKNG
ncbi:MULTISPECIES: hypothetical protein [Hafnia]|uniref:Uncharacterized protein n=1 Tax=Hafnia alvei ATCC 51873 TaxID=1002364 RepID=G9Y3T6_HAFAL|nr:MULTISPECIES: hypothetical protein [Hafnia]EHM45202.1 hypothetical protein HMPREF0454_01216 [Hafnia alvei ATCC 51873]QQE45393.1 hypothetical protein I6H95_08955 [Hafnia alvei]TBL55565.1 hypothetical protein EYZ00_03655 [Hafnia paralvei]